MSNHPNHYQRHERWGSISASRELTNGQIGRYVTVMKRPIWRQISISFAPALVGLVTAIILALVVHQQNPNATPFTALWGAIVVFILLVVATLAMDNRQVSMFIARDDTSPTAAAIRDAIPQEGARITRLQRRTLLRAFKERERAEKALDRKEREDAAEAKRKADAYRETIRLAADREAGAL